MIIGSMVALVTPMHLDGSIDWAALDKLVDWHKQAGTKAIIAVGTTGESATLNVDEHTAVIKAVVKRASGELKVIAGTGANSTSEAIELTLAAKSVGADACLSVTPYYNKPTQEGLYLHYKAIVDATQFPLILYNVPGRTCCDLANETVVRLAKLDNIIGIKDATAEMDRVTYMVEHCPKDFGLYSGDDATALEYVLLGGHGSISVTANIAPEALAQVFDYAANGEAKAAKALDENLSLLHKHLFCQANPIPVKWTLGAMGKIGEGIRLPLTPLEPEYHAVIKQALSSAEISYE